MKKFSRFFLTLIFFFHRITNYKEQICGFVRVKKNKKGELIQQEKMIMGGA